MDTAVLVVLLIVALWMLRVLADMQRQGSTGGVRTYDAPALTRKVDDTPQSDLEGDVLYIWRLRCSGQTASRRELVRRGDMRPSEWNKASAVINHLALDTTVHSYAEGAAMIRAAVREHQRLARSGQYVPPWSG